MTSRNDCSSNDERPGASPGATTDVAGHIVVCSPCDVSLDALKGQGDALKYLSAAPEKETDAAVIRRVLADSARAGRQKLADLLYELAKACLQLIPNLNLRLWQLQEPRAHTAVTQDLSHVGSRGRLVSLDGALVNELEHPPADKGRCLTVAEKCAAIRESVIGWQPSTEMLLIHVSLLRDQTEAAEARCRQLVGSRLGADERVLALTNLVRILNLQGKYKDAFSAGIDAYRDDSSSFLLGYNLAVALAWLGDRAQFELLAHRIRRSVERQHSARCEQLVNADAATLAVHLGTSEDYVLSAFGVDPIAEASSA